MISLDGTLWKITFLTSSGKVEGTAHVIGDDIEDLIERWNNRYGNIIMKVEWLDMEVIVTTSRLEKIVDTWNKVNA